MGWAHCGTDDKGREVGYGVTATCDYPGCTTEIHRGLAHLCGDMHGDDEWGCGGYFCSAHLAGGRVCIHDGPEYKAAVRHARRESLRAEIRADVAALRKIVRPDSRSD